MRISDWKINSKLFEFLLICFFTKIMKNNIFLTFVNINFKDITGLPQDFLSTPLGAQLKPLIDSFYGGGNPLPGNV